MLLYIDTIIISNNYHPSLGAILNSDQVLLQAIVDQALMVGRDWTKDRAMHF